MYINLFTVPNKITLLYGISVKQFGIISLTATKSHQPNDFTTALRSFRPGINSERYVI